MLSKRFNEEEPIISAAVPNNKFEKENILNIIKKQKEFHAEIVVAYLVSIDHIHKIL